MKPARKTSSKTVHAPISTPSRAKVNRSASPPRRGQTRTVVASPVAVSSRRASPVVKHIGVPKPPAKRNTFAATELVSLETYAALKDRQQQGTAATNGAATKRRRQIDPTTCERDYSNAEVEFMNALDDYKRLSGRLFPTCSEILEVIRGLGYAKTS